MKQVNTLIAALLVPLFCGIILLNGCETESVGDSKLIISPSSARIAINKALALVASGGFEYTWSLDDETLGTLSTRKGARTVYTSRSTPLTNTTLQVQIIRVTSTVATGGATNGAVSGLQATAEAFIEHIPAASARTAAAELNSTPASLDIAVSATSLGTATEFTASGGDGTYTWTISSTAFGFISNASGSKTSYVYTDAALSTGTVILTVRDNSGRTFNIPISHFL